MLTAYTYVCMQCSSYYINSDCILEDDLLTHAMEAHYCDCIIEGGLLTHAMEAHYCGCIIEGGLWRLITVTVL